MKGIHYVEESCPYKKLLERAIHHAEGKASVAMQKRKNDIADIKNRERTLRKAVVHD